VADHCDAILIAALKITLLSREEKVKHFGICGEATNQYLISFHQSRFFLAENLDLLTIYERNVLKIK